MYASTHGEIESNCKGWEVQRRTRGVYINNIDDKASNLSMCEGEDQKRTSSVAESV
jgi:hypothetical protein